MSASRSGAGFGARGRAATSRPGPRRSATGRRVPIPAARPTRRDRRPPPWARPRARSDAALDAGSPSTRQGHDEQPGGVPRHVGVVPRHDGHALARGVHPGRAEEVVTLEHDALGRRVGARPERDDAAPRPRDVRAVHFAYGQDPVPVGRDAQPAVVVHHAFGRRGGQRPRPWPPGSPASRDAARAVAEPHPLVGVVHVGEGAGCVARHEGQRPAAVLVDAAADADIWRRMIRQRAVTGAHEDDSPGLGRPGLEPVEGFAVRTKL